MKLGVQVVALWLLLATSLEAQGLRERFRQLFDFGGSCGQLLCLNDASGASVANAFTSALAQNNELIINFVSDAIGQSVANIPVPATSSGTIPEFVGGQVVARSLSAGPVYAERAPTLGMGRLLLGVNVTALDFNALRGVPLDNLTFNFQHVDLPGSGPLGDPAQENNILQVDTEMAIRLLATSFFATFGLTNGIDVGVAVPLVRTTMAGRSEAQIVPFGENTVYSFGDQEPSDDPNVGQTNLFEGSSTGIGDIAARLKINFRQTRRWGIAFLGDVRFPTGNEEELLGLGEFTARGLAILSAEVGPFAPHVNMGYRYRDRPDSLQNHAILANVGFDQLLTPGVTLAVGVISELEIDESALVVPAPLQYQEPFTRTVPATTIPGTSDDRVDVTFGFKFTPSAAGGRGFTVVMNSLIPLNRGGLRSAAVWSVGLEHKF